MNILIGIFAARVLASFIADHAFPPLEQTTLLGGLSVTWFAGIAILTWGRRYDDKYDTDSYYPRKIYLVIAFIPWLISAAVAVNSMADSSKASAHTTVVVSRSYGRYGNSISVASWRSEGQRKTFPVNEDCYELMTPGRKVTLMEKDGALGVHWIAAIMDCSRRIDRPQ